MNKRWCVLRSSPQINESISRSEHSLIPLFDNSDLIAWHETAGVDLIVSQPTTLTPSLRRTTYAQLRSKFSALAEYVTKATSDMNTSRSLSVFLDNLSDAIRRNNDSNEINITHVFQQAMSNTFRSEIYNDDEQFQMLEYQCPEAKDEIEPVFEQPKSTDAESRAKEPEQKRQKIVDPRKRADTRSANGANVIKHKTRPSRKQRTESSRSVPPIMRNSNNQPIQIPKKMKLGGYACPYCTDVKVQNNRINVLQHIHAKHKDRRDPTIQEMREAACNINKQEPDDEEMVEKIDAESDHDSNRADSIHVTKLVPKRSVKLSAVSKKWHSRCTRNVLDNSSVDQLSASSEILLFNPDNAEWSMYSIVAVSGKDRIVICSKSNPNEHLHIDLRSSSFLWRVQRELEARPKPTWHPSEANDNQYRNVIDICAKNPNHRVKTYDGGHVLGSDFMRLESNDWLDDTVVESFLKTMAMKSTHFQDRRTVILGSQMWKYVQDNELHKMDRVLRGFPPYHADLILSPYNISDVHWILCVIDIHDRVITIIDPVKPTDTESHAHQDTIKRGINRMFRVYDEKFGVTREWRVQPPENLAKILNLPAQPDGNKDDCGVLTCMYGWSLLTGTPWPTASKRGRGVKQQYSRIRKYIGSFILK